MEKKGKREEKGRRKREKERLGRRPVTRYRKRRLDNACHVPSTFAQKATMFEPLRKNSKNAVKNKKNANLSRANTGSSPQTDQKWHLHRSRRPKVLTTVLKNEQNATKHHHHYLQLRENATNHRKHDKLMSKIRENTSQKLQKRQFDVQN